MCKRWWNNENSVTLWLKGINWKRARSIATAWMRNCNELLCPLRVFCTAQGLRWRARLSPIGCLVRTMAVVFLFAKTEVTVQLKVSHPTADKLCHVLDEHALQHVYQSHLWRSQVPGNDTSQPGSMYLYIPPQRRGREGPRCVRALLHYSD